MDNIPHIWKMKQCLPDNISIEVCDIKPLWRKVYVIIFFKRKRAVLLNRGYVLIGTMETRYARKLLEEAEDMKWVDTVWKEWKGGDRPVGYTKKCECAYWIDYTKGTPILPASLEY